LAASSQKADSSDAGQPPERISPQKSAGDVSESGAIASGESAAGGDTGDADVVEHADGPDGARSEQSGEPPDASGSAPDTAKADGSGASQQSGRAKDEERLNAGDTPRQDFADGANADALIEESITEDFADADAENLGATNEEGGAAADDEQTPEAQAEETEHEAAPQAEAEEARADALGDTGISDDFDDDGDDIADQDAIVSS
jgi:hypothetical protein